MSFRYAVIVLIFCCLVFQAASGQGATSYDSDGIKFNHPADAISEAQGSQGSFSAVSCISADGSYLSVCVFRDKTTVDEAIKIYRERLEKDCVSMNAGNVKFIDIQEPILAAPAKGFQLTYKLKKVNLENRTLCTLYQDKVICIVRQCVIDKKATAETFFQQILSTLKIQ